MIATAAEKRGIEVVRGYVESVFNGREYEAISDYQTADYVQHGPFAGETVHGNAESLELMQMFHEAFPDVKATEEFCFSDGECVCSRYTYTGTHDGELLGIDPTGTACAVSGTVVNKVVDGKIAEAWVSLDLLDLMQQLEVVPEFDAGR